MYATRLAALGAAAVSLALATGCASRGPAVPQPFPTPGGPAAAAGRGNPSPSSPDASPDAHTPPASPPILAPSLAAQTIVDTAMRFLGTPYRNGGAAPDGFDCSGFVYYVFAQAGLSVPRTVEAQAHAGAEVGDIEPGDLVFFRTSGRGPTHVGIALGPDRFIHAPSSRGEVRIEPLARPYWAERYLEGRRLF